MNLREKKEAAIRAIDFIGAHYDESQESVEATLKSLSLHIDATIRGFPAKQKSYFIEKKAREEQAAKERQEAEAKLAKNGQK